MVEGARLESVYTSKGYRGFESLSLRFSMNKSMALVLILAGIILLISGWLILQKPNIPFGRLPGDIRIRRPGFTLYIPIVSCLVLSILLTVVLWVVRKITGK